MNESSHQIIRLKIVKKKPLNRPKMGKPQRRRKVHFGDTHLQRRWRTRNRKRDLDLVSIIIIFIKLMSSSFSRLYSSC